MIKNAPFRFSDFESIEITYGYPQEMLNSYNSKTQDYQYVTSDDKVVKEKLKLRDDDLLYLHRKAQTLGFFNVDDDMTTVNADLDPNRQIPRYILKYTYKDKSKQVTFDADYPGVVKMKEATKTTIDEVLRIIAEAKAR
ncbi:hypothetical protein [Sphingobacterium hungaricum]|uniref:Uncharacterized protein n=1 Tax=Sphingobacterium hungaricum TaxID=2082723 RepID=A0A928V0T5_9SPHI|nr:hypothetical protein [Sphingobacterium hungaricum]MBE8714594.1 hypothetical protein [Sphingobacterium hungaricum]